MVPSAVRRLLRRHVHSVGELELLLLLRAERERPVTAEEICAVLQCPPTWAAERLDALSAAGLAESDGQRWRFAPASADLERATSALEEVHHRDAGALARFIFAGPRRGSSAH